MSTMNMTLVMVAAVMLAAVGMCMAQQPGAQRSDVVTGRGKPLTLQGQTPKVGDAAPAFVAVGNDMANYQFDPKAGAVWIICAVPSLDTPVCSTETRRFNEEAGKLGEGVKILTISMDLPFAQKRWCGAEGVKNLQTVSDYRDRAFSQAYGVRIKENGLLARSVFVVDKTGTLTYVQIVPELTKEPDYEPVLQAARKAAGK